MAYSILDNISDPKDLRGLDVETLSKLAEEISDFITKTVSKSGGHLASSLGAVELTLAVHYVFNTPEDLIVWDVGHQAYAHKIITGRREKFHTLRQKGGISGFPRMEESPYDVFNTGHSSTSISVAAGLVEARKLKNQHHKVVAIIGDGSMGAGMAFEGMNFSGYRKEDLIIILNDNEMSISPNVGALSAYLNSIMTGEKARKMRAEVKHLLLNTPVVGEPVIKLIRQVEEALKNLFLPGALFEDLGFTYVGPIDGHRLDYLVRTLENVKEFPGPVLLHVITKKGKGYSFAEREPEKFHGTPPFDLETGLTCERKTPTPSYTQVFGETIIKLAQEEERIVTITAAMSLGTGLDGFARKFPDRFFDVGIAEQHGVTFAAGLAREGFIPVVAIYSTFLQRAYDQIIHDVCLPGLHVIFAIDRAGFVGEDGATHQGLFDLSYLRAIPKMSIMVPADEDELRHMLKTAIHLPGPVAIRYPRGAGRGCDLSSPLRTLEVGKGEIVREGEDLAICAVGPSVYEAMSAADELAKEGISTRIVNARFVKPLDRDLLVETAKKTKNILTVEENVLMGGFGSAVLELLAAEGITDRRIICLGVKDTFVEHATPEEQRREQGVDKAGILSAAKNILSHGKG